MEEKSLRERIYDMVEEGDGTRKRDFYDCFMIIVILISLIPLMDHRSSLLLTALDHITVAIFIVDYILRWITADYKFRNRSFASFLFYPFTPMAIVDLISILPSLILISKTFKAFRIIRLLKAFRAFRAFRLFRYSTSVRLIMNVMGSSRSSLVAVGSLVCGYILLCSLIIFNVEPEMFDSFYDAIYWATVSLTTIGYGDLVPTTFLGKLMTILSAFFGVAVIALPAGIMSAEFMNELQKQEEAKKEEKLQVDDPEEPKENGGKHENL